MNKTSDSRRVKRISQGVRKTKSSSKLDPSRTQEIILGKHKVFKESYLTKKGKRLSNKGVVDADILSKYTKNRYNHIQEGKIRTKNIYHSRVPF
jgi:hypothetical protein